MGPAPCGRCTDVILWWLQLDATEQGERSAYAKSTIVAASAPRELGSLRQADGAEGFDDKK